MNHSQMTISSALEELGAERGSSEAVCDGKVAIEDKEPVIASRHHRGESTSVLLALFGMELAAAGLNAERRPECDLPLVTSTGPLGEMSVLPPQVECSEVRLGPRFSGEPNGASRLDWSVFTETVLDNQWGQSKEGGSL